MNKVFITGVLIASSVILGHASASAAPALGSVVGKEGSDASFTIDPGIAAYAGHGQVQSLPWVNRVNIEPTDEAQEASGFSFWGINQKLVGAPGNGPVSLTYLFDVDGSYSRASVSYPFPGAEYFNVVFGAFHGELYGTEILPVVDPEGETTVDLVAQTSFGTISLWDDENASVEDFASQLIGFTSLCDMENGCAGGNFDTTLSLSFDIGVDENYFIVGFIDANQVHDRLDFFHTAKLNGIALPASISLLSDDDGALTRDANGRYTLTDTLPGAVPEPASWVMMIAGFGLVGQAMRRRAVTTSLAARR